MFGSSEDRHQITSIIPKKLLLFDFEFFICGEPEASPCMNSFLISRSYLYNHVLSTVKNCSKTLLLNHWTYCKTNFEMSTSCQYFVIHLADSFWSWLINPMCFLDISSVSAITLVKIHWLSKIQPWTWSTIPEYIVSLT